MNLWFRRKLPLFIGIGGEAYPLPVHPMEHHRMRVSRREQFSGFLPPVPVPTNISLPVTRQVCPRRTFCCARRSSVVDVTWHSKPSPASRPLLFISGLDGTPLPEAQIASLTSRSYAPIVSVSHAAGCLEADWESLTREVSSLVEDAGGSSVVLVGESFGAALALRVAALRQDALHRLVLVNSGTALGEDAVLSGLTQLLPLLKADASGKVFYRAAALLLFNGFLADRDRLDPDIVENNFLQRTVDIDRVPLDTMLHRVHLLRHFSDAFPDSCLRRLVSARVTLVASGRDRLLQSEREASRLRTILPNVEETIILKDSAHACLLETDVRLGDIVGDPELSDDTNGANAIEGVSPAQGEFGPGSRGGGAEGKSEQDLSKDEALEIGRKWLGPWFAYARPTFTGCEHVTKAMQMSNDSGRPVLFVGNHGVYGIFDTSIVINELSRLVGPSRRIRALAHETHFSQFSEATNGRYGRFVRAIGAVPATPRNFFKLLKAGEPILLFPGGSSEVCRRKGEKNIVQWKSSTDFVRPAIRHDAILVPFSTAGADDSVDLVLDGQEMQKLPVVGPALTRLLKARNFDPEHIMPLGTPPKPVRFRFRFHNPIPTVGIDANDSDACSRLYQEVKETVQSGVYELSSEIEAEGVLPSPRQLGSAVSAGAASLLDDLLML